MTNLGKLELVKPSKCSSSTPKKKEKYYDSHKWKKKAKVCHSKQLEFVCFYLNIDRCR